MSNKFVVSLALFTLAILLGACAAPAGSTVLANSQTDGQIPVSTLLESAANNGGVTQYYMNKTSGEVAIRTTPPGAPARYYFFSGNGQDSGERAATGEMVKVDPTKLPKGLVTTVATQRQPYAVTGTSDANNIVGYLFSFGLGYGAAEGVRLLFTAPAIVSGANLVRSSGRLSAPEINGLIQSARSSGGRISESALTQVTGKLDPDQIRLLRAARSEDETLAVLRGAHLSETLQAIRAGQISAIELYFRSITTCGECTTVTVGKLRIIGAQAFQNEARVYWAGAVAEDELARSAWGATTIVADANKARAAAVRAASAHLGLERASFNEAQVELAAREAYRSAFSIEPSTAEGAAVRTSTDKWTILGAPEAAPFSSRAAIDGQKGLPWADTALPKLAAGEPRYIPPARQLAAGEAPITDASRLLGPGDAIPLSIPSEVTLETVPVSTLAQAAQ